MDVASGHAPTHNGPAIYKKKIDYKSVSPKSLNLAVRQREYDRIQKENRVLAVRLFSQKSKTTKKSLDKDFEKMDIIRQRLQKVGKKLPGLTGRRNTELPALNESVLSKSKRSVLSCDKGHSRSNSQNKFSIKKFS